MSEWPAYEERYFASSEGLELFYRDYKGARERLPVLCIPGLTRNSRDFEFIAAHMAVSRRVIVADLRGRGKSAYAKDPRRYTVAIEAADMFRLLDHADVREVILLGTSRGGLVAMTMAATRPDVLRGVILNDIGGEIDAAGLRRVLNIVELEGRLPDWNAAVRQLKQNHAGAFPDIDDARWNTCAHALYREENGQVLPDYDPALADAILDNFRRSKTDERRVTLWTLFSALTALPTLVLRGENSDFLSEATLERMHAQKPDLVSAVVRRRVHAPFLDEPETIAAIDEFLEKTVP